MSKKHLLAALLLVFAIASVKAQKNVTDDEQTWFATFTQTRLTNKWGIWADAHLRLKDNFVGDLSQGIVRAGPMYYLSDDVRLTAAYAYVHTFPAPGHANIGLPEHRPWQQVQWFMRGSKARLMQWVRLEERFRRKTLNDNELGDGYNFNWRIRYNFALFIPITKKRFEPGGLQFLVNDELMVNFGKNIVYNHFDQNRFFCRAGVSSEQARATPCGLHELVPAVGGGQSVPQSAHGAGVLLSQF